MIDVAPHHTSLAIVKAWTPVMSLDCHHIVSIIIFFIVWTFPPIGNTTGDPLLSLRKKRVLGIFKKFDGTNFTSWKFQIIYVLISYVVVENSWSETEPPTLKIKDY